VTDPAQELLRLIALGQEKAGKATPAPWGVSRARYSRGELLLTYRYEDVPTWLAEASDRPNAEQDFHFIAAARTALPAAYAALRVMVEGSSEALEVGMEDRSLALFMVKQALARALEALKAGGA
jgi:hypothetical protein